MTQIKLRRDTAANFTSKNPVLGVGEPAYETDTKKLKIGDGTTAYTQLEYFSTGGGGGSTNISATLPLKIVDGVISLEVDGQTIQIVDGKLHANLDELGNEVNSLTGEVADLAGRVTAVEADIIKKEDELTPVAPITINKYVKSNLHGFSFTTDGTGVYATSGKSLSYVYFDHQSDGYLVFRDNTVISRADESWACYIDVPISLGQVVKFPVPNASYNYYPMCILGKTDATGHFTVITHGYALEYKRYNPIDDALVFSGTNVYTRNKVDYEPTSSNTNPVHNQDQYTGFVQLFENEAGTFSIQMHKCNGGSDDAPTHCTYKYVISDVSAINRFKEINTVRIVPCYYGTKNGKTADSAISVNSIGLYNCSTDLFSLNNDMSQFDTGNLFNISGETAHNYLELSIGSGLTVTDGKLTANSTAPTNMVTTDTAQTITGSKTFNGTVTLKSAEIGNQISALQVPLYTSNTTQTLTPIIQSYTDLDKPVSELRFGSINNRLQIRGSAVVDKNNKKFLTQGSITGTDNIAVTETADGVQISSTGELNNPYSLFDSKYSGHELNNLSWLKSEGQQNPKVSYPDAYNKILENVNKSVKGFLGQTMYMWGSASGGYMTTSLTPVVGSAIYEYTSKKLVGYITGVDLTIPAISFRDDVTGVSYTNVGRYTPSDESSSAYITDYDFVLNTTDETFRLPLLNGSENLPSNTVVSRADNTTINAGETKTLFTASHNGNISIKVFSTTGGNTITAFRNSILAGAAGFPSNAYNQSTISFDVKRGDVVGVNLDQGTATYNYLYSKAVGNGSLYYYVGETVQNPNLIDAGKIGEELVNIKASIDGDWTYKKIAFADTVSLPVNTEGVGGVFTYDLSNYLPNDGYKYEVTISVEVNNSSFCTLGYYLPDNSWYSFAKGGNPIGGWFNAIVDSSRQVKISVVNTQEGLMWVNAAAYRRLGKKV